MTHNKAAHKGIPNIVSVRRAIACIGMAIGLTLVACGSDSDNSTTDSISGPGKEMNGSDSTNTDLSKDEKPTSDVSKKNAVDSVDTEDDLVACVSANEGDSAFVRDSYSVFRCSDGLWGRAHYVLQLVKSEEKLPECKRSLVSLRAIVKDSSLAYRCGVVSGSEESWVKIGKVLSSETELPNCTANRKGERAFIKDKDAIMVCEAKWTEWEPDDRYLCGGSVYNADSLFCAKSVLYRLCGGNKYDPSTQFCYSSDSTVYEKCGGKDYYPYTHFCVDNVIYDKCQILIEGNSVLSGKTSMEEYDVKTEFCTGEGGIPGMSPGEILKLCNGLLYESTSFCANNHIFKKCSHVDGGTLVYETYDVETNSCENGALVPALQCCSANGQCNTEAEQYNANFQFCDTRDYQIYDKVTIGRSVWMAQNMNYRTTNCYYESGGTCYSYGGWCYDDDVSNCDEYGMLYTEEAINDVCPEGWRLPTESDFESLYASVEKSVSRKGVSVIQALKSTSGWSDGKNGLDLVGFNLLPSGFYSMNQMGFFYEGIEARFWSADDDYMPYMTASAIAYNYGTSMRHMHYSIRCVQSN